MSKNKTEVKDIAEDLPLANPQGKTVEELVQIAQTLQLQKNQHQEKANQAQAVANQELQMVTKAQGGLEVVLQMIPKERVEQMIAEDRQVENHQANGQKTS